MNDNIKLNFKKYLEENLSERKGNGENIEEISDVVLGNSFEEFFEVNKLFGYIATNAIKHIDNEDGNVKGVFKLVDIENAIQSFFMFCIKYEIEDKETLLQIIKYMHSWSIEHNETNTGLVMPNIYNDFKNSHIQVGQYVNLTEIPEEIWDKIVENIEKRLNK